MEPHRRERVSGAERSTQSSQVSQQRTDQYRGITWENMERKPTVCLSVSSARHFSSSTEHVASVFLQYLYLFPTTRSLLSLPKGRSTAVSVSETATHTFNTAHRAVLCYFIVVILSGTQFKLGGKQRRDHRRGRKATINKQDPEKVPFWLEK